MTKSIVLLLCVNLIKIHQSRSGWCPLFPSTHIEHGFLRSVRESVGNKRYQSHATFLSIRRDVRTGSKSRLLDKYIFIGTLDPLIGLVSQLYLKIFEREADCYAHFSLQVLIQCLNRLSKSIKTSIRSINTLID